MKQVIQSDFFLPQDIAGLIQALNYILRLIAVRLDGSILEGTEDEKPDANGSKRFFFATDTNILYYDSGTWVAIGAQLEVGGWFVGGWFSEGWFV